MKLITIDIKSEKQTVSEAIAQFLVEVDAYKKGGFKVMKIIHGYGSHGVGGAIRSAFLKKCEELKRRDIIYDYTCCDKWTDKNVVKKIAINYCPDLIADGELRHLNAGCSIVIL
ncbi:MAG: hypothetical protein E7351_02870 [Clostridiales bacterium]|nr:hypothetical protein [Clostridiales bacterium]